MPPSRDGCAAFDDPGLMLWIKCRRGEPAFSRRKFQVYRRSPVVRTWSRAVHEAAEMARKVAFCLDEAVLVDEGAGGDVQREAIALAAHGLQNRRVVRIVAQLVAQACNQDVDCSFEDVGVGMPGQCQQLGS